MSGAAESKQPFLIGRTTTLAAPTQVWSAESGELGGDGIDGIYFADVRLVSELQIRVNGEPSEPIATVADGADAVEHVGVLRFLDEGGADPTVRLIHRRRALVDGVDESVTISSALEHPVSVELRVRLAADLADMDTVKRGKSGVPVRMSRTTSGAAWGGGGISAALVADGCDGIESDGDAIVLVWRLTITPGDAASATWRIRASDTQPTVFAAVTPVDWRAPVAPSGDDRLDRWVERALDDLASLRMSTRQAPGRSFLAAGAPWFFTLFGRDSIWAARFLLPLGGSTASDTLAVLAALQGTEDDIDSAEQPGKIMHELRRVPAQLSAAGSLPPLYYGTIDATPLWICLLCDAAEAGMSDDELARLVPHLERALAWMRDFGDSDGDGLLEYIDESGRGLANQGWKDSGDSVRWVDGRVAAGPIALCEVQGYAYEAAVRGGALLDRIGRDGSAWAEWAATLKARFAERYWIDDPEGAYPAIALDGSKRAVDGVTSNIGHLLGTGLLDPEQAALVARRLVSPEMSSGFGLRTRSTASAAYWPLSYHGGSVWTHDTAIAIRGLALDGFTAEAAELSEGLLRAAVDFDYRMPELHSGDAASDHPHAIPYPAACRPQAWSAAAALAVRSAVARATPDSSG